MIKVTHVFKNFETTQALSDVSLQVQEGELFGLIGPDGAGKTTLMRIVVSLLNADEGTVHMAEFDVKKQYKAVRKIIGYMPGRFSLYQDLTVEENLSFFAAVFGTTIQKNYYLIKDIYEHIEPFKNRRAGKLSGGMKQKLALSCALIHKPKVLVLDEPTTGVDAVSRKEFWQMLKKLKKEGITILVSTPYMDEADMCDRIALIQKGQILAMDSPKKIVEDMGKSILLIKTDEKHEVMKFLREWPATRSVYPFGRFLHWEGEATVDHVLAFLKEKGLNEVEVKPGFSGIEDIFMDLMAKNSLMEVHNE